MIEFIPIEVKKYPEVNIEPELFEKMRRFGFNHERFREGIELAGVPGQVSDSLRINFKETHENHVGTASSYDIEKHDLNFMIGDASQTRVGSKRVDPWEGEPAALVNGVNFSLAYHASRIADIALRSPDELVRKRHDNRTKNGRLWGLLALTTAGAITGAEIADSSGAPVWLGSALGAGSMFAGDAAVMMSIDKVRGRWVAVSDAEKSMHERALDFARSEKASELFSKVTTIELA